MTIDEAVKELREAKAAEEAAGKAYEAARLAVPMAHDVWAEANARLSAAALALTAAALAA